MLPILLIISLFIHHNFMKMSELFIIKLLINVKFIDDYNVKLVLIYYIIELCMITNMIFMYNMIFVGIKLLVGSWLTCWLDQKSRTANRIIFRFRVLFCMTFELAIGQLTYVVCYYISCYIECN